MVDGAKPPAAEGVVSSPLGTPASEEPSQVSPPPGRRMLRLDEGAVLRRQPRDDADSVHVTRTAGLFEIQAQQGPWYRLRLPAAVEATDGWVRLVDGQGRELLLRSVWQVPRPSRPIEQRRLDLAKQHMLGGGRSGRCGPYPLLTDVEPGPLLQACDHLANALDDVYDRRFGVQPLGQGGETILLFRQLDAFRRFVQAEGSTAVGYAGHASASRGYLAMYSGSQDVEDAVVTLAHELTHLVSWRALGGPLPRWLSEGLADGIGDSTTLSGIGPLRGISGLEVEAQRLRQVSGGRGLPKIEELVRLSPEDFDAGSDARHYEHSALWVRFLLLDAQLAPRFRAFLADLAAGQPYDADHLQRRLAVAWPELDRRFAGWLAASR